MYMKLKLIVISAVLLNFSECNNCDDILKCVTNWVGGARYPNTNSPLGYINNISVTNSTFDKVPDSNSDLLTNLSQFIADQFSSLIKEGQLFKSIGEKTKIYVQSFKINEDTPANKLTDKTVKPDVFDNNNNNTNINDTNVLLKDNVIDKENTTVLSYESSSENQEYYDVNMTLTTPPTSYTNTNESKIYEKHTTDTNHYIKNDNENANYNLKKITNEETATISFYVNTIIFKGKNEYIEITTERFPGTPAGTTKVIKHINDSDINSQARINNTTPKGQTHEVAEITDKINIQDNYIDDTNDLFSDTEDTDITEIVHDNFTDYLDIDYVDMYKDTTNEDVEYTSAVYIPTTTEASKIIFDKKPTDGIDSVYPWIATVFVMNPESKQFEYICDGSLLSERVVLTAARCVLKNNVTVDTANILIILGKRSLQSTGPNETVLRVQSIKIHDSFVSTEGKVENDLAIAVLAEPVVFNVDIQPAPLGVEDKSAVLATATTGWHVSGPLQPLYLTLQSTENSGSNAPCGDHICAILGDSETTCPSYGGLFIERLDDGQWRLKGIASGSPVTTGVCFNKHLTFTKIGNYFDWITKNIQETSSI